MQAKTGICSQGRENSSTQILVVPTVSVTSFTSQNLQLPWYLKCKTGPSAFLRSPTEDSSGSEKQAEGMQGTGKGSIIETEHSECEKSGKATSE